jgi:hypothetical protein
VLVGGGPSAGIDFIDEIYGSFPLLILFVLWPSPTLGAPYVELNGFRYQLANAGVDADASDLTGDDCAALPCPSFAVPPTCSASYPTTDLATVAQRFGQCAGEVLDAVHKLEPHTGSLSGGLEDDRRFPPVGPGSGGIDEALKTRRGNTGFEAAPLGEDLVEGVE